MENYGVNKTILLVDDELDFCFLISQTLRKQGFKVVSAHTLESAKTELAACDPTIILLDHNLPDGLGTEFLEKNKSLLERKYVIYITGDKSPELRSAATGLGIFDFLPKPFHPSALNK